jgi:hypothetical protein
MLVCNHLESHLSALDGSKKFFLVGKLAESVSVCVRVAVCL